MIYFLNNDLELQKIVTSENINRAQHEDEMNNLKMMTLEMDLAYAKSFLNDDIDHFGYYVKDKFHVDKIRRVEESHDGETVTIIGHHIFFSDMIYGRLVEDVRPENRDAAFILNQTIGANTRWHPVITDTTGILSTNFYWTTPMEVVEFVVENFRLEFEPEILFDGQKVNGLNVHFKKRLGEDKPKRVVFGPNTPSLQYDVDYSEIVTKLAVHGKGEEVGDGYGRRINFSDRNINRNGVISPLGSRYLEDPDITANYGNFDNEPKHANVIFEDIENVNELIEAGIEEYERVSRPQYIFTATVADIGNVNIGDSVLIVRREHGIYFRARVHKISVDLLNPQDAEVVLGDYEHFKETKVERSARRQRESNERAVNSRITQLKNAFDARFDGEVAQMWEDYEQALIDAYAEIAAAEQRMVDDFESFSDRHESLIDDLQINILDIDDEISGINEDVLDIVGRIDDVGDSIGDINQWQNDALARFGTVESDLSDTRDDLQSQLDDAKASIDGIEVGGRNLIIKSGITNGYVINASGAVGNSNTHKITDFIPIKANTEYIFSAEQTPETERAYENLRIGFYDNERNFLFVIFIGDPDKKGEVFTAPENARFTRISVGNYPVDLMLMKGNVLMDYQPAPEDTEAKITTLNQQIEFIDGQLEAKLNRTEIEPIQNKITEFDTQLEADAESISLLQEKTELHDDDITQWSNLTESTAEELTRTLSRVSGTEKGLESAQTELTATADGLSALITRTDGIDTDIVSINTDITGIQTTVSNLDENLTGEMSRIDQSVDSISALVSNIEEDYVTQGQFEVESGIIEALVSRVGENETDIGNLSISYDDITATVASLDSELNSQGAQLGINTDAITSKVWLTDVSEIGTNLIPMSANAWEKGGFWTTGNPNNNGDGIRLINPIPIVEGARYTFHDNSVSLSRIGEIRIFVYRGAAMQTYRLVERGGEVSFDADGDRIYVSLEPLSGFNIGPEMMEHIEDRINMKLEFGDTATPIVRALSRVEQLADRINMRVFEELDGAYVTHSEFEMEVDAIRQSVSSLADIDGSELIQQSDIIVEADRILIGSQQISSWRMASIISVNPTAVDVITESMNISADMNVAGDIRALSLDAVRGDINHIVTNYLDADVIDADHVKTSHALIDKIFASNAYVTTLTSKSQFTRDIQAIEINTNQLNMTTLLNSAGQVEGGYRIKRPDGFNIINNGMPQWDFSYASTEPRFYAAGVGITATYYTTSNSHYTTADATYFHHTTRYVNIRGYAYMHRPGTFPVYGGNVRLTTFSESPNISSAAYVSPSEDSQSNPYFIDLTLDLGRPTGKLRQLYTQMRVSDSGGNDNIRFRRLMMRFHG